MENIGKFVLNKMELIREDKNPIRIIVVKKKKQELGQKRTNISDNGAVLR